MSDSFEPTAENPGRADAHAQQETLKADGVYTFADPDTSLLQTGFGDAPAFPAAILGMFWQE